MRYNMPRRQFLALGGSLVSASVLSSCGALSLDPEKEGGGEQVAKGRQSPMLDKRTDLPPVEERLPANPKVIQPLNEVGVYGGTLQTVEVSTDPSWLWMTVVHDHLITWDPSYTQIIPNVAEKFEVIGDGKEYTFTLREGMKWSDGEPFNADDLMFWYQEVLLNKSLTPVVPNALKVGDKPVVVEKLGEYQVKFVFPAPNALFLEQIAIHGPPFRLYPRHYLEPFHKKFKPDLDDGWAQDFLEKIDELNNVDLPVLSPWIPKNPHGDGGRQVWERNPFYWKVDPDGSQLPYIDEVVFSFLEEGPLLLRAANGDVDFYQRSEITVPKNQPVLSEGQEGGNYKLVSIKDPNHNTIGICFNLTHADSGKRRMLQNKDFRIGLSHAINRQQIIDIVYLRQGEIWQTAPRPEVPFYTSDDFGKQYTEFNLDLAREHLDKAGYDKMQGNKRLGPDGKPIVITVLAQSRYPDTVDAMEFVKRTWADVGVELRIDSVSPELVTTRLEANQYDCTLDKGELGYLDLVADPRWLFATGGSSYAPLWSNWYEGGSPSEAPPEAMQRQVSIYRDRVVASSDRNEQYAAIKEIIEIARDEFWTLGVSLPGKPYAIVSNRMHNVPGDDQMWLSFKAPFPAVVPMTQFFIK
jgi:peptide/nickel transport system substrate-binding protein